MAKKISKKNKNSIKKIQNKKENTKVSSNERKKNNEKKNIYKQKKEDLVKNFKNKINSLKEVKFDLNLLKIILPIFLILLVMFIAYDVRSGPVDLDGLEKNVENNLYSQIRNVIEQDIRSKYSNLNEAYIQEEIAKEYQKLLNTGEYELQGQKIVVSELAKQQAESVKDAFKAENGQTYLNAIDPYLFYHFSTDIVENGHKGDILKEDESGELKPFASYRVAPIGRYVGEPTFHEWLEANLMLLNNIDKNSSIGEKIEAIFLIPVIFAILSSIPIFMILRTFTNDLFALFGSLFLVSVGTFVSRTIAGFVDTDAYNVFFPLMIVVFLIYGFLFKDFKLTILFSIIAGFFQGLFMWAWGSSWFIFVFIVMTLIGYIGYVGLKYLIDKSKKKDVSQTIRNDIIVLLSFVISSFFFGLIIANKNIFETVFGGIFKSLEKIATVSESYIWPNVFSSVAELNPASFNQIISSVGGDIIFVLALLGVLILSVDFKLTERKQIIYRRLLIIFSFIWFLVFVKGTFFNTLIANNSEVFLVFLFLPIGVGLLYSLINGNKSEKIFLTILLSIWMAGTIYMSLNGTRFILLLAPAFAISFGLGLFYISRIINDFFTEEFKIQHKIKRVLPGFVLMTIVFLVLFSPIYSQAQRISDGTLPNFDDAWYDAMYKIKNETSEDAIITSWWDFGHFFAVVAERGVTFDGGSQTTPRSHWVGKLLMENDEEKAVDILRMLTCGGNEAHNLMLEYVEGDNSDAVKINKIIYDTLGEDLNDTRVIIEENKYYDFSSDQVDNIMSYLACEEPRENILITSEDMVGKAGVWAHWGSWDFTKKYVHDNYKKLTIEQIAENIDENVSLIERYVNELETIDTRSKAENIKRENLINQWFAPYPSYIPIQGRYQYGCASQNETLICENGVIVDMKTGEVSSRNDFGADFKNLVYPTANGELGVVEQSEDGQIDVLILPTNSGRPNVMLMQYPLGASLFTKLFYLDGLGTKHFEKFDDKQSVTGVRVKVWKTIFNINETEDVGFDMSNLEVSNIEFEATKDQVEEIIGENISSK